VEKDKISSCAYQLGWFLVAKKTFSNWVCSFQLKIVIKKNWRQFCKCGGFFLMQEHLHKSFIYNLIKIKKWQKKIILKVHIKWQIFKKKKNAPQENVYLGVSQITHIDTWMFNEL
jgi:hypothetical protein